jgi:hypothetical protein
MRQKFKLRDNRQQHLATVLYFYEEQLLRHVGMIITIDLTRHTTWLYQNETIPQVIADLAARLNIAYHDYIEVQE